MEQSWADGHSPGMSIQLSHQQGNGLTDRGQAQRAQQRQHCCLPMYASVQSLQRKAGMNAPQKWEERQPL